MSDTSDFTAFQKPQVSPTSQRNGDDLIDAVLLAGLSPCSCGVSALVTLLVAKLNSQKIRRWSKSGGAEANPRDIGQHQTVKSRYTENVSEPEELPLKVVPASTEVIF